jgi:hypothetical protein
MSVLGPPRWEATYNIGDSAIRWVASDPGSLISQGRSVEFGFTSSIGPASQDYVIVGLNEITFKVDVASGRALAPVATPVPEPGPGVMCVLAVIGIILRHRSIREQAARSARRRRCYAAQTW